MVLTLRDLFQVVFELKKQEANAGKKDGDALSVVTTSGNSNNGEAARAQTLESKKVCTHSSYIYLPMLVLLAVHCFIIWKRS